VAAHVSIKARVIPQSWPEAKIDHIRLKLLKTRQLLAVACERAAMTM
jgi:hypothetical protein